MTVANAKSGTGKPLKKGCAASRLTVYGRPAFLCSYRHVQSDSVLHFNILRDIE